jgi:hypothetical protein
MPWRARCPEGARARCGCSSPARCRYLVPVLGGGAALLVALSVAAFALHPARIDRGWRTVYDGYGKVGVEQTEDGEQVHYLSPMRPERPEETHAALKTTVKRYRDLELTLRVRTIRQLRQHGRPNPWETAWVIWHYTDDRHFYYLTLKPNGWEIGKRDPAYQGDQRFLASDKVPVYYFNTWYDVRIVQVGDTIAVWANGMALARFRDLESAYGQGRVGLYVEDAYAQFADVHIQPARAAALGRVSPW